MGGGLRDPKTLFSVTPPFSIVVMRACTTTKMNDDPLRAPGNLPPFDRVCFQFQGPVRVNDTSVITVRCRYVTRVCPHTHDTHMCVVILEFSSRSVVIGTRRTSCT